MSPVSSESQTKIAEWGTATEIIIPTTAYLRTPREVTSFAKKGVTEEEGMEMKPSSSKKKSRGGGGGGHTHVL
jgi:hypothetical protein